MLSYTEDFLSTNAKYAIYLVVGVLLVVLASLREIGIDPDSAMYERYFNSAGDTIDQKVEFSFIWICNICRGLSQDVHLVFFVYALLGVSLKLIAFPKLGQGKDLIMMLAIYLCYAFELHETTQIRTGILSSLFLLAIPYIADNQRWKALVLLAVGSVFHLSGLALIPLLLLTNKPLSDKSAVAWIMLIPLSYLISAFSMNIDFTQDWGYIGSKIAVYQKPDENGDIANVHIFSPLHFLSIAIACYLMFFHKMLTEVNSYFPILIKIYIIALFVYASFSFFPVVGERMCNLLEVVWIPLLPLMAYPIVPRYAGKTFALSVGFILMNYILRSMYQFVIFLAPLE